MKRPNVSLRCPADVHHGAGERIIEFSFPDGTGGLISFRETTQGKRVCVYRVDADIHVDSPDASTGNPPRGEAR
jgi:hypothetical protein